MVVVPRLPPRGPARRLGDRATARCTGEVSWAAIGGFNPVAHILEAPGFEHPGIKVAGRLRRQRPTTDRHARRRFAHRIRRPSRASCRRSKLRGAANDRPSSFAEVKLRGTDAEFVCEQRGQVRDIVAGCGHGYVFSVAELDPGERAVAELATPNARASVNVATVISSACSSAFAARRSNRSPKVTRPAICRSTSRMRMLDASRSAPGDVKVTRPTAFADTASSRTSSLTLCLSGCAVGVNFAP